MLKNYRADQLPIGWIKVKQRSYAPHCTPLERCVGVCGALAFAEMRCGRSRRDITVVLPSVNRTVVVKAVPV